MNDSPQPPPSTRRSQTSSFSWLTPGAALGAPATIYVLGKRGVGWHHASVIAIGKSLTGISVVIAAAALFIALGHGPDADASFWAVAVPGIAVVATLLLAFVLAGLRPERSKKLVGRLAAWLTARKRFSGPRASSFIEKSRFGASAALESLAELFASRVSNLVVITASHLTYFATLAALGAVLATSLGAESLFNAFAVTLVYVAFSYIAPTPGGAGIAEAFALPFYGAMLPAAEAVVVVLLFRALTFYLHLLVGLPYLLLTVGRRGLREAMSKSRDRDDGTD